MTSIPRPEYPRPQFVRNEWLNLNGPWEFEFDDSEQGLAAGWEVPSHHLGRQIIVPFPFEATASGIGDPSVHRIVWYRRELSAPQAWQGRRILLHFGAVDYAATVWVNGRLVGCHRGGYTAFSFDITDYLQAGANVLTVRVVDELTPEQPRGKQSLTLQSHSIWYTRCTGIWRTVWLEPVAEACIDDWHIETDVERGEVEINVQVRGAGRLTLSASAHSGGRPAGQATADVHGLRARLRLALDPLLPWSPDDPQLYDLDLELSNGESVIDHGKAYFGLREVGIEKGFVTLNGAPCYQKLVLDQSYWPDGVYTAPSDDAMRAEVEWIKRLGFNGVRKHQVSSDPRFLYWADRLGLLVWADMPGQTISRRDAPRVRTAGQAEGNYVREWSALIQESRNHPSIIAWVTFNETWGIDGITNDAATRAYLKDMVRLTRLLDPTRLVVDNDGWEHGEDTDVFAIHDYSPNGAMLKEHADSWAKSEGDMLSFRRRPLLIPGAHYGGQPIIVNEYGGIGLLPQDTETPADYWFNSGRLEPNVDAYLARYRGLQEALAASPHIVGYCYTQLTDVEQEVNGLLTFHRRPKVDPDTIKALNDLCGAG